MMELLMMAPQTFLATLFLLISLLCFIHGVAATDFDPYVMNGGLLAAVAGRDFIVVATDTRLIGPTGYDILDRHHIASRIWAATPLGPTHQSLSDAITKDSLRSIIAPDGSLNVHLLDEPLQSEDIHSSNAVSPLRLLRELRHTELPPVVVGSVGCQVDCEHLKRSIRADLRAATYFGEVSNNTPVNSMAVVLSQMLYSRRAFPFGCYCILGGLSSVTGGQVYVYDAIGSYEQVAVSCTGTGFELLQPILDRKFTPNKETKEGDASNESGSGILIHRPATQVDCSTVEEALHIVLAAYRSVAEREIGVGDHVVFYTIQKLLVGDCDDDTIIQSSARNDMSATRYVYQSKIWTAALKKH